VNHGLSPIVPSEIDERCSATMRELTPEVSRPHEKGAYLHAAAQLCPLLERADGFISVERFESLSPPGKILSSSYPPDENAVAAWRNLEESDGASVFSSSISGSSTAT
jgi:hypothetical protein